MSFMRPEITIKMDWWEVDGDCGMFYYPANCISRDEARREGCLSKVFNIQKITGHGARLSAPGYLDCTEWSVHDTEAEAAQELIDMYYDMSFYEMTADQVDEYLMLVRITKGETP